MTTDAYAQADAIRCEIYGLLRLMRGCSLQYARGASYDVWALRYLAATQAMQLAQPRHDNERRAA